MSFFEEEKKEQESAFGPTKYYFSEIILNTFGAFIAGVIGSVLLLVLVFGISSLIDIPNTFEVQRKIGGSTNMFFPFLMSLFGLIAGLVTTISTYKFLNLLDKEKYRNTSIHLTQIGLFSILVYIFVTPIYIYSGLLNYDNIMYTYIFHMIVLIFGTTIILEIMNNYRYVLVGIYGSFIAIFITICFSVLVFSFFSSGFAKLVVLLFLIPIINSLITFIKELFQFIYYRYYKYSGLDILGDVFSRIEDEENEKLRQEEEENQLY